MIGKSNFPCFGLFWICLSSERGTYNCWLRESEKSKYTKMCLHVTFSLAFNITLKKLKSLIHFISYNEFVEFINLLQILMSLGTILILYFIPCTTVGICYFLVCRYISTRPVLGMIFKRLYNRYQIYFYG